MRFSFGSLRVTIKNTYVRGQTTIYQRAVPTDLRSRYPGATIKQVLKTTDPIQVARLVEALNKKYEAEWEALRASPEVSPTSLKSHASKLLRTYGIDPSAPEVCDVGLAMLEDHFDRKRTVHAKGDEVVYVQADPEDFLNPAEVEALDIIQGRKAGETITAALDLYIATSEKRDDKKFTSYTRTAFAALVEITGDKPIKAFNRADARRFMEKSLEASLKTGTVRRRLNSYRAIWTAYRRERDHTLTNPFEGLAIPGEGLDAKKRVPFTPEELQALIEACRAKDDDRRWIVAMLADSGARLAEVVGLALSDIKLDTEVPHMVIQRHPWRPLKNASSARTVPLVGAALWAATRVRAMANEGQQFAFPRYTAATQCNSNNASAALNKWVVEALSMNHSMHELRHTMADRLKAVQCPKDIRYAIDGHAAQDVGDLYGTGFGLAVKQEWLQRIALTVPS